MLRFSEAKEDPLTNQSSNEPASSGDISSIIGKEIDNTDLEKEVIPEDQLIDYKKPFYYCKQHPKIQNIYKETIEHHI